MDVAKIPESDMLHQIISICNLFSIVREYGGCDLPKTQLVKATAAGTRVKIRYGNWYFDPPVVALKLDISYWINKFVSKCDIGLCTHSQAPPSVFYYSRA